MPHKFETIDGSTKGKIGELLAEPDGGPDERPSLLIICPRESTPKLQALASAAGYRILAVVMLSDLDAAIRRTVGADAVLADLRGYGADASEPQAALAALTGWWAWSDCVPVVLTDLDSIDVAFRYAIPANGLLCNPTLSDITAALCMAPYGLETPARLHDIGEGWDAARLEELSAEVRRLARNIDRLAQEGKGRADEPKKLGDRRTPFVSAPTDRDPPLATRGAKQTDLSNVQRVLQIRRMRDRFLPGDLFADPAWDMMLDLMAARLSGKNVSVSSLCIAAAVPPTTALRWIAQLTQRGLFIRSNDPEDARRVFISLSDDTAAKISAWFTAIRSLAWQHENG